MERARRSLGTAGRRLLARTLWSILPLLIGACAAGTPTTAVPVRVSFASDTYDGAAGHGVRVVVRLDNAPGRTVVIPLLVTGAGQHRLFAWDGAPVAGTGERSVRSVSAVSFDGNETEKELFVQTTLADGAGRSTAIIRFGSLPEAVAEGRWPSAEIKTHAASKLVQINNLTMPHPARADFETIGTLGAGGIAFAEFNVGNANFDSVTAMGWKETADSSGTVTNVDIRAGYVRIVDAAAGTETLSFQIPVENQCPDLKNAPQPAELPCVIDDIDEVPAGHGMLSRSNHILQARLAMGRYHVRTEAVTVPGPYRVSIHFNEVVQCYPGGQPDPCPADED